MTEAGQRIERARILVNQNRWKEAESECGRALASQGADRSLALYYLAWAQQGQGRYDDAIATASRCIAEDPEVSRGYHVRAVALRKKGEPAKGEDAARQAVQKDAETTEYRSELAWNLLVQGRAKEALEIAEAGLSKYPEAVNLHRARTEGLTLLKNWQAARESAQRALALDTEDSISVAQLGVAAYNLKDLGAAEKHFAAAMRIRPGYEYARQYLRRTVRERLWFRPMVGPLQASSNRVVRLWILGFFGAAVGMRAIPHGPEIFVVCFTLLMTAGLVRLYTLALATPLCTMALRRKPVARGVLTRDELDAANWVLGTIVAAFTAWTLALFSIWPKGFGMMGLMLLLLPIPLSRGFEGSTRQKWTARVYTALVVLISAASLVRSVEGLETLCLLGSIMAIPMLNTAGKIIGK